MNSLFLHIYAAPDESRESALADLMGCLPQQGIEPTVHPVPFDDRVKIVAEMEQQLFDSLCQALEAWGASIADEMPAPKHLACSPGPRMSPLRSRFFYKHQGKPQLLHDFPCTPLAWTASTQLVVRNHSFRSVMHPHIALLRNTWKVS